MSSVNSAPMSESGSENGATGIFDPVVFPVDRKFKSDSDKARILALPEIEREQILAERAHQIEREEQNRTLRALLETQKVDTSSELKRKASNSDLEDDRRRSTRVRTTIGGRREGESSAAIEEYKKHRELKEVEQKKRQSNLEASGRVKHRSPSADRRSSTSSSEKSADEALKAGLAAAQLSSQPVVPARKDTDEATFDDVRAIKVGQDNLSEVMYKPGFVETMKGCFGRVRLDENTYRAVRIDKFDEDHTRPYEMLNRNNNRPFYCAYYVTVMYGSSSGKYPCIGFSMKPITENEWRRYGAKCAADKVKLPTVKDVNEKFNEITSLIKYRMNDREIGDRLAKMKVNNNHYNTVRRAELERERDIAAKAGDEATLARCEKELQEINGPRNMLRLSPAKAPTIRGPTHEETLAKISAHARKANKENQLKYEAEQHKLRMEQREKARLSAQNTPQGSRSTTPLPMGASIARIGTPTPLSQEIGSDIEKVAEKPKSLDPLDSLPPHIAESFRKRRLEQKKLPLGSLIGHLRAQEEEEIAIAGLDCGIEIDL